MQLNKLNNVVTLAVNPILEKELRPLTDGEYSELRKGIKRDGVLDAIKYWHNPSTQLDEIVDGHNRYRIAQELTISYSTLELEFKDINGALYWMHRNNAGRRDGKANGKRMAELYSLIKGDTATKTEIVKQVAKDANVSERAIWQAVSDKDKPKQSALDRLIALFSKLSDDDKQAFRDAIK